MADAAVVCRLALASAPFAGTPTWNDVSTEVRSFSIRQGRQHELDRIEAGVAILDLNNDDDRFWPSNTSGAYYPNVLPGKRLNIRATYGTVTYDLFTGFVEAWQPTFLASGLRGPIVTITAVDLLKNISTLLLNDGTGYAQQGAGDRVAEVLDDLGWTAADRDINVAQSTMIATGAQTNVNAGSHLQTVQESEQGLLFVAGDGDVQFQDRHARLKAPFLASAATFGDDPAELPYQNAIFAFDDQYIYNDVRITRSGGTEQVASDATSQTDYGKRSLAKDGLLMTTDLEALAQAQWLLARLKAPALRLRSITILPGRDPDNLFSKVLQYDISTRVTIRLDSASVDADYHIEGRRIDWRPGYWAVTWELSDADSQTYWVLGTSQLGVDTRLAY